jgi:hypothetical protein
LSRREKRIPEEFRGSFREEAISGSLDVDLLRRLLSLGLFRHFHGKYAFLEARFDLVGVNTLRQFEATLERAEAALLEVVVLLFLFFSLLFLFFFSSFSSCLSPFMVRTPSVSLTSIFFSSMPGRSLTIYFALHAMSSASSGAQIVIAFLLAPLLTIVRAVGFVMLRRAHDFGARLSSISMGIELMHETSPFLGGLKLAGQNRQANFVAEFQDSLDRLKREQLAYLGQENRNRLAASIIAGLVGALIAFVGLVLFDVHAAVILTMLFPNLRVGDANESDVAAIRRHCSRARGIYSTRTRSRRSRCARHAACTPIAPGAIVSRDVSFRYDRSSPGGRRDRAPQPDHCAGEVPRRERPDRRRSATGHGRLSGNSGQGSWSGRSSTSQRSGHWEAERRG